MPLPDINLAYLITANYNCFNPEINGSPTKPLWARCQLKLPHCGAWQAWLAWLNIGTATIKSVSIFGN